MKTIEIMNRREFLRWLGLSLTGAAVLIITDKGGPLPHMQSHLEQLIQKLSLGPLQWEVLSDPKTLLFLGGPKIYEVVEMGGGFSPIGWHIPGEMGGLWAHPIKLLDGFSFEIEEGGERRPLFPARLLTHDFIRARWEFEHPELLITREDGTLEEPALFVNLTLQNLSLRPRRLTLHWQLEVDLRPAWQAHLPDGKDELIFREGLLLAHQVGSTRERFGLAAGASVWPQRARIEGARGMLEYDLILEPHGAKTLRFLIVAAHEGASESAAQSLSALLPVAEEHLTTRGKAFEDFVFGGVQFASSERFWSEAFWCAKANLKALIAHPPTLGRYPFAGVPEYVQLFGNDLCYSVGGLMAVGLWEEAREALRLLARFIEQQRGRVPHEISTGGFIVHPGNANETAQFVTACSEYFHWSKDRGFLEELYPLLRRGIFDFLLGIWDSDGDLYPEGEGIVERAGMGPEKLDVTCYLYRALLDLAEMAEALARPSEEIAELKQLAQQLRERFNRDWWLEEEGLFADSLSMDNVPRLAGHWTVAVPMEVGIAGLEKGQRALARIERDWLNEWGLVHTRGQDERVWTLPTAVLALAEFNYGRVEMGLRLLRNISLTAQRGMLGAYPELIPEGGDLMQLWSGAMLIRGLIEGLWGLRPRAHPDRLRLAPKLPPSWNSMSLEGLKIGTHQLSLSLRRSESALLLSLYHLEGPRPLIVELPDREIVLEPQGSRELSLGVEGDYPGPYNTPQL